MSFPWVISFERHSSMYVFTRSLWVCKIDIGVGCMDEPGIWISKTTSQGYGHRWPIQTIDYGWSSITIFRDASAIKNDEALLSKLFRAVYHTLWTASMMLFLKPALPSPKTLPSSTSSICCYTFPKNRELECTVIWIWYCFLIPQIHISTRRVLFSVSYLDSELPSNYCVLVCSGLSTVATAVTTSLGEKSILKHARKISEAIFPS